MIKRILSSIVFFIFFLSVYSYASMQTYCAFPPSISNSVPVNLMLVLDYSGSMSFFAYPGSYYGQYSQNNPYDQNATYYGYFEPDKMYTCSDWSVWPLFQLQCNGYWSIDNNAAFNNSNAGTIKYDASNTFYPYFSYYYFNIERDYSGNVLNWLMMTRIDILRWILTGGPVINGSYVESYYTEIRKQGASSYDPTKRQVRGILQKIEDQNQKPRIGAIIFKTRSPYDPTPIFKRIGLSNNYINLINEINSTHPIGGTPTKKALNDVEGLYKENHASISKYNGVNPYIFIINGKKVTVPCAKNFVLLMSDGEWRGGQTQYSKYDPIRPTNAMWEGGNADLVNNLAGDQNVKTFTVSMFADPTSPGVNALKWIALYGNYLNTIGNKYVCNINNNPKILLSGVYPDTSLTQPLPTQSDCGNEITFTNGNPKGYFSGQNPLALKNAIQNVFNEVLKEASSGTAASVLATSSSSAADMIQALFWPERYFDNNTKTDWTGTLNNLWFYLGPNSTSQEIREDSDTTLDTADTKNFTLLDKVVQFFFDKTANQTKIKVCEDKLGSGNLTNCSTASLNDLKSIWNAGYQLWRTPANQRYIFTDVKGLKNNATEGNFTTSNNLTLMPYLNVIEKATADNIIQWIRGNHISGYRNRLVNIKGTSNVWKLGDIIDSTPRVLSPLPVNFYYRDYNDKTYYAYNYNTNGTFAHPTRGMVFVGANDGMLHAFRLGALSYPSTNNNTILATLTKNGGAFGSEAWAFIPKNALPYLQYLANPNYCHLYTVDLTPYLIDASIGSSSDTASSIKTSNSWHTILIGGFNLGGAVGNTNKSSIQPPQQVSGSAQPPLPPSLPPHSIPGFGLSSYFALDVTNTNKPKVMWDFSDKNLGFTTTGPAIIHIPYRNVNGKIDNAKDGYWYVVFASGPDDYKGESYQPLYLYVLNLKTGSLIHEWQLSGKSCNLPVGSQYSCDTNILGNINAFAGRMFNSTIDTNNDYADDGLYFGYTYNNGSSSLPDWKGGVLRLATGETVCTTSSCSWTISKLIGGIGPVTAKVTSVVDLKNNNLWVYFGSGRYFTKTDDLTQQQALYGVKDPCFSGGTINLSCNKSVGPLINVTKNASVDASKIQSGWYINLNVPSSNYAAERLITDPVVSINGFVIFSTFEPTSDICGFGGDTYVWDVNYDNGETSVNPDGTMFIQTSTGVINKIILQNTFNGNRKLKTPLVGASPSASGMTIIVPPKPVNKVLQWVEK